MMHCHVCDEDIPLSEIVEHVRLLHPDAYPISDHVEIRIQQDDEVRAPVEDQAVIDSAPPEVSQIANAIGYALAERGVTFTADDAIAAAYRVAEQSPARNLLHGQHH